ncbi:MAG: arginine--tRNA ligase [Patescibacteria group bacterium]
MKLIQDEIKKLVIQATLKLDGVGREDLNSFSVEHPADSSHGDYATNVAMVLAGKLKRNPLEIAKLIKDNFEKTPEIDKIEVVAPGFINFYLSKSYLSSQASQLLSTSTFAKSMGKSGKIQPIKKVMVEFAHPNTHKELHVGHMRTLILGEALSRILVFCGREVFRANYQGDIGPHVAKSIWGVEKLLAERNLTWDRAEELSLTEKAHLLGEGYVLGNQKYDIGEAKEAIDQINNQIYDKDDKIMSVYQRTRKWSLDYYDSFYQRFDTKFDRLFFEGDAFGLGKAKVEENIGRVFEKSQGAIIFDGGKYGLNKRVFITNDGNPTYEGKDMGLVYLQYQAFPFDLVIHVVANEQIGYFKVVIKAMELMDSQFAGKQYHLPMGMVNLIGAKMSSRTGVILKVDGLLDEIKKLLEVKIDSEVKSRMEREKIAEIETIAAVKYANLKTDPKLNVAFDINESVSLHGNSGPYLQYTYARCFSVLLQAKVKPELKGENWNEEEMALLRTFYRFSEVILLSAEEFSPHFLCQYLFELAQKYNLFYQKHKILGDPNRLFLTQVTANVLKIGLDLLGIEVLEKM